MRDIPRENRTANIRNFFDISQSLFCMKIKAFGYYDKLSNRELALYKID